MARTVGERDRARGSETVSRPRNEPSASQRRRAAKRAERKQSGAPRRSEDAETIDEALDIERETGRREGMAARAQRPVVRYGKGERVDAPPAERSGPSLPSFGELAPAAGSGIPAVTFPMLVELGLISVDELTNQHRFPIPSRLLVAFAFFGVLGLARGAAARPAAALGWGVVVATFYSNAGPKGKPPALSAIAAVGDFFGGKYATTGQGSATQTAPSANPGVGHVAPGAAGTNAATAPPVSVGVGGATRLS